MIGAAFLVYTVTRLVSTVTRYGRSKNLHNQLVIWKAPVARPAWPSHHTSLDSHEQPAAPAKGKGVGEETRETERVIHPKAVLSRDFPNT